MEERDALFVQPARDARKVDRVADAEFYERRVVEQRRYARTLRGPIASSIRIGIDNVTVRTLDGSGREKVLRTRNAEHPVGSGH